MKATNAVPTSALDNRLNLSNDEINEYFASNFTRDGSVFPVPTLNENGFKFSSVDENDVILAISSIKYDAIGLDDVPIKFIRLILPQILPK